MLAAILCGSLSHDTGWAKSDIDLVLVTVDDGRASESSDIALNADGVNVHAQVFPRALFRKTVEGSLDNSFVHSYLAKGRLLYTHDPTIAALEVAERYVAERATGLFRPVLDYLREAGDARAASEIEHHFKRAFDLEGVTLTYEYLADQGYLGKVSTGMRATKKSTVSLQELAFFYPGGGE